MGGSRLLIIDVQNGFLNEWTAHVPSRVEDLQSSFDHIIVTRLYNPQRSLYRKLMGWTGFSLGAAETQLAFHPRGDSMIIDKSAYSCLTEPFVDRLRNEGVNRVHLCGIATEDSVLATALDLFQHGIEPVVLAHACGSDGGHEMHEAGIKILRHLIGAKQVIGS